MDVKSGQVWEVVDGSWAWWTGDGEIDCLKSGDKFIIWSTQAQDGHCQIYSGKMVNYMRLDWIEEYCTLLEDGSHNG